MIASTAWARTSKLGCAGSAVACGAGEAVSAGGGVSAAGAAATPTFSAGAGGSTARASASTQATEKIIAAQTRTARPAARTIRCQ